jgi:hypothetical protein
MKSDQLSRTEQIEYYLGKDKFKDIYFKKGFPSAYEIQPAYISPEDFTAKDARANYRHPEIPFRMNNLGYRNDFDFSVESLKGKKLVLCLGCTDTFGMHDYAENIWPGLLLKHLPDYTVLNLGIIGASRDTVARILTRVAQELGEEIKYACILWPHPSRREWVSKEYTKMITSFDKDDVPFEEYWDFIDWKSNNYNSFKNYHLIKNVCLVNQIKMLDLELDRFDKKVPYDYNGPYFALGPDTHNAIANYFAKIIKGQPSLYQEKKNGN